MKPQSVKQIKKQLRPPPPTPERKFFVLREVEVEAEELRKGDVFRIEPASVADHLFINPREFFIVREDPKKSPIAKTAADANVSIQAAPVAIIERECMVAARNFGKWNMEKFKMAARAIGAKLEPEQKPKSKKSKKKKGA